MSIMIFNVNIYRTRKKNRILKIKWNKYNIIQFPQCLFEEISMEIFFSFFHFFKFSLSGSTGCVPSPPEISLQLPHMLFIFIIFIIFIYIYIFNFFCKLEFFVIVTTLFHLQTRDIIFCLSAAYFTSFDLLASLSNMSQTGKFQEKRNTEFVNMLLCYQKCWQMILILRVILFCHK